MGNYIAFFDESYSEDEYFIVGLLIPEEKLHHVEMQVGALLQSLGGVLDPYPEELHAHELMTGRGLWKPIATDTRLKISILRRTLRVITGISGVRIFVEGIDVGRRRARNRYPENPHTTVFRQVLESIDSWAVSADVQVRLVADDIATRDEHQGELSAYKDIGTGGYPPRKLESLHKPISFLDSRQAPGLQLSDTLAYLFRRRQYLHRVGGPARSLQSVERLLAEIDTAVERFRISAP